MLDIRFVRDNPDAVQQNASQKGYDVSIAELLRLDDERRSLQQQADELREKRNANAAKMKGGRPDQALIDEGKRIKVKLAEREGYLVQTEAAFTELLKKVPNMAADDVPVGASEDENVEVKVVGDIPTFDFAPKNHYEIAERKGWLD
jgi:seryl-tRNA synthetase